LIKNLELSWLILRLQADKQVNCESCYQSILKEDEAVVNLTFEWDQSLDKENT